MVEDQIAIAVYVDATPITWVGQACTAITIGVPAISVILGGKMHWIYSCASHVQHAIDTHPH